MTAGMRSFSVSEGDGLPVVVEIPHAGLSIWGADPRLESLQRERMRDADLFVADLFAETPRLGAALIHSHVSRWVVDLNRATDAIDGGVVEGHTRTAALRHGLLWRTDSHGVPLPGLPVSEEEYRRRQQGLVKPYHRALRDLLDTRRRRHGWVLLLSAHSMPSMDLSGRRRADVVPGSQGKTTCDVRFLKIVEAWAHTAGLSLLHDDPYAGGFVTTHYAAKDRGVHALQLELSRALYMKEESLELLPDWSELRARCSELVRALGSCVLSGIPVPGSAIPDG